MGPQSSLTEPQSADATVPPVEVLGADMVARFCLAALAYVTGEEGKAPDLPSAEAAIDVASSTFERIKERLRPEERLAITQLLTETRMTFVKKRGL